MTKKICSSIFILLITITFKAQKNLDTINIDQFSTSSCYIEATKNNRQLWHATGFFVKVNSKVYLITNNHVIGAEFHIEEKKRLFNISPTKDSLPDELHIRVYKNTLNEWRAFMIRLKQVEIIKFWDDEKSKKNLLDIVAIEIQEADSIVLENTMILTKEHLNPALQLFPTQELFIVGFPLEYVKESVYPVWKMEL